MNDIEVHALKSPGAKTAHLRLWAPDLADPPRSLCNQVNFSLGEWHREWDGGARVCPVCSRRLEWVADLMRWLAGMEPTLH